MGSLYDVGQDRYPDAVGEFCGRDVIRGREALDRRRDGNMAHIDLRDIPRGPVVLSKLERFKTLVVDHDKNIMRPGSHGT